MTLSESVAKLRLFSRCSKRRDAKFASDLIASFKKYGGLTPKQEPWIGKLIARAEAPAFTVVAPAAGSGQRRRLRGRRGALRQGEGAPEVPEGSSRGQRHEGRPLAERPEVEGSRRISASRAKARIRNRTLLTVACRWTASFTPAQAPTVTS